MYVAARGQRAAQIPVPIPSPIETAVFDRYGYVMNSPLSNVDPLGLECVWDDGSYDAADDPETGSDEQCTAAGGTWETPEWFEGMEGTQSGDWSGKSSQQIVFDMLTPSTTANAPDDDTLFNAVQNTLSDVQQIGFYLNGIEKYSVMDVFNWAASGNHTPVGCASGILGCLYHHGNWCGMGGSGAPVDTQDAACLVHDFLYAMYGFTPSANFDGYNPALQEINQGLCDTSGSGAISTYFGPIVKTINIGQVNWLGTPACN
jgi:hypothetical protein